MSIEMSDKLSEVAWVTEGDNSIVSVSSLFAGYSSIPVSVSVPVVSPAGILILGAIRSF